MASLEANASDLGQRIRRAQEEALREKRQGQKGAALVHVRRVKQFQVAREKRLSSLYTLEAALNQVRCMWCRFRSIRAVLFLLLGLGLVLDEQRSPSNYNLTARLSCVHA